MAIENETSAVKKIVTYLLTSGVILSVGSMSFAGALMLSPSIIIASVAFFCSGFVEGEVYKQNIIEGINELKYVGFDAFHALKNDYPHLSDVAIHKKVLLLRLSLSITLLASLGSALATAYGLQTTITTLGLKFAFTLSTAVLSACIWPLATIAAIGYGFLIYHTICDMIKSDFFSTWQDKIKRWLTRKKQETTLHYIARMTALTLLALFILTLGIAATFATAGTWWFAVKNSASLVIHLQRITTLIRDILVPITALTQLIFTLKNALKTMSDLLKTSIIKTSTILKNEIKQQWAEETFLQFINPFRLLNVIILTVFRYAVFIGHLIAMGLTSDRVASISPIAITVMNGTSDGLQDFHFFLPGHAHDDMIIELPLKLLLYPLQLLSDLWHATFKKEKKPNYSPRFFETAKTENVQKTIVTLPYACYTIRAIS